ncbi:hypothetical protein FBY10_106217 [Pseudomonas sp. SJZ103]|nr:hypothetical protein FBY10_106217 [Pseudomonas sp. SJZ103]TWC86001.1 hypothetical protein FBY08_106217 [Pseudomonas sp. SJZ094]
MSLKGMWEEGSRWRSVSQPGCDCFIAIGVSPLP